MFKVRNIFQGANILLVQFALKQIIRQKFLNGQTLQNFCSVTFFLDICLSITPCQKNPNFRQCVEVSVMRILQRLQCKTKTTRVNIALLQLSLQTQIQKENFIIDALTQKDKITPSENLFFVLSQFQIPNIQGCQSMMILDLVHSNLQIGHSGLAVNEIYSKKSRFLRPRSFVDLFMRFRCYMNNVSGISSKQAPHLRPGQI